MNLLQLVNQTRVECGVSGNALGTVQNLTGEAARITAWVQQAWIDIQTAKEDWNFLRQDFTFNLTAQQWKYSATDAGLSANFGNWKRDSFRCSSVGQSFKDEQLMNFMDWNTYRNLYQYGNQRTNYTRPVVVTITPDKSLGFGSVPDQAYVIDGEYYTKPVSLSADGDIPAIPDRFHMMIVYRAMYYYAGYENAPEVLQRGNEEFKRLYSRFEIDQLPTIVSGPPLA